MFTTNKWVRFGLSAAVTLLAGSASLDWSTVLTPTHAAGVAAAIGAGKMVLNAFSPGANTPVRPTGGKIITQKAV